MEKKNDKETIKRRIQEEEDYIRAPKFSNSLNKFTSKNSDGAEDSTIARLLQIPEEEVQEIYDEAVEMLREKMAEHQDE